VDTLAGLDATEQAELVASGVLTPADLLDAVAARIALVEPIVHSLVSVDLERVRRVRVSGPFGGVPFLVKDSTPYPGLPWTLGSRLMKRNTNAPSTPFAKRIDDAGLVVIGKSALSELGLLASTETLAFGVTHNPWDLSRSAGGSSGGAAAAVAAGIVPLAHANDGGGSIRIPASVCGVFGFKPSRGRTVASGLGSSDFADMTSDGCVSRTVRDAARFISAIAEPALPPVTGPSRRRLRIGASTRTFDGREPDPDVQRAHESTVSLLRDLGHTVEPMTPPVLDIDSLGDAFFVVAGAAVASLVTMFGRVKRDQLEPFTWALHDRFVARGSLDSVRGVLADGARAHLAMIRGFDAVLTPVVATPAWPLGHLSPLVPADELIRRTAAIIAYTPLHNVAGCPAMSIPLATSSAGLPIGVQLSAAPGEDALLLALAYELEEVSPWSHRIPLVSALRA
jgi:amidase